MVLPVCDVCLKSGMLCQGCENKLKSGEITQMDLDIAKILGAQFTFEKPFRREKLLEAVRESLE